LNWGGRDCALKIEKGNQKREEKSFGEKGVTLGKGFINRNVVVRIGVVQKREV